MRTTAQQPWLDEELEPETDIDADTLIQPSEKKSASEERLVVLRTLLKKRRERESITRQTVREESPSEKSGVSSTASGSEKPVVSGTVESYQENLPSIVESRTELPSRDVRHLSIDVLPSAKPDSNSNDTLPTYAPLVSESMSLLDESANHMLGLMRGLHANQPAAEVNSYDPERVNSAVACANTIYKIMRLKLDAIKVQRKLTK